MAEIKVTPQHSASYIDSRPKKLEASLALPFVCVSYIGASDAAVAPAESTVTGTVDSATNIAQLSPANAVTYIDSAPKKLDASLALPYACVSYVPASAFEVTLNVDLRRTAANAVTATFDTSRSLVTTQTVNADTSRNTAVAASLYADTVRNVGKALTANFDTARKIANAVNVNLDTARELASGFKAWLRFDESTSKDEYGNKWTAYNAPTISADNAAFGKALQLTTAGLGANGQFVALDDGCTIGGQDFTIDGWAFMPSNLPRDARIFSFCNVFGNNAQKTFYLGQKATTGQLELNYNNNWSALSANLKGQRFHFAVVYEHSKNLLTLYVNGQVVGALNQTFTRTFYQYVFVGRANYDTHSTWLGVIDEFRIDDGLARWTENFTPPTLNDYTNFPLALSLKLDTYRNAFKSIDFRADSRRTLSNAVTGFIDTARLLNGAITVAADTSRLVSVPCTVAADTLRIVTDPNVWRYENYGTASLLSVEGTTVENLDKSKAIYKTAFYQTEKAKCFDIPSTKEIWIKCDIYTLDSYGYSDTLYIGSDDGNGFNGWAQAFYNEVYKLFHNGSEQALRYRLGENTRYRFLLHMKSGVNDGVIEVYIGGNLRGSFSGNVNNGADFQNVYISMGYERIFVSNLIISNAPVDINENVTISLALNCDILRFFPTETFLSLDSFRKVFWTLTQANDLYRNVKKSAQMHADTLRFIEHTVQFICDAIRTLPHDFILSPVEELGGTPDTSNDGKALTQSIEIRLNEQSLTDEVVIVTVKPVDIMEQVKGQYLDYKYNMRVETCKQRGILNTCTCCSDIDEILFKQLEYTIPGDELWRFTNPEEVLRNFPGIKVFRRDSAPLIEEDDDNSEDLALASTHIATIANIIGKKPILQYADFISTVDITAGGTTYNDLIRSIFGWTARIPQMMINCFLRDDKLYVIQRGFEEREINLSNLAGCEIVGVDKDLVRTIWGSSVWSKTETREVFGFRYLDNLKWSDDAEAAAPSESTPKTSHGSGGLIEERVEQHNGVTTTTHYTYDSDDLLIQTDIYVDSKDVHTHTETRYKYVTLGDGRKVLAEETIRESELTAKGWVLVDEKTTRHEYTAASPGQVHHYTTDSDGNVNNVMGSGTGDDRRTPYAKWITAKGHKSLISYTSKQKNYQQQRTIYGLTPFDTSFPVHGDETLIEITNAIKWLNRKTQETLTINLFDYPHVIDFNDRIVINGNTYYLKGNTALKTPRIVNKQTLALVRWY